MDCRYYYYLLTTITTGFSLHGKKIDIFIAAMAPHVQKVHVIFSLELLLLQV